MIEQFKQHITKRGIQFTEKDFQDNRDYMKRIDQIRNLLQSLWRRRCQRVLLEGDPQVLKALELIPEAKDLASKARRQVARTQLANKRQSRISNDAS